MLIELIELTWWQTRESLNTTSCWQNCWEAIWNWKRLLEKHAQLNLHGNKQMLSQTDLISNILCCKSFGDRLKNAWSTFCWNVCFIPPMQGLDPRQDSNRFHRDEKHVKNLKKLSQSDFCKSRQLRSYGFLCALLKTHLNKYGNNWSLRKNSFKMC